MIASIPIVGKFFKGLAAKVGKTVNQLKFH
jgi:hypothetical protein